MNLRNCPQCGKVFTFVRTNLCPECQDADEENFKVVRKYIAEHPGVGITEVSENTGIAEEKILRYMKEGRFSTDKMLHSSLQCELCGASINTGRYCLSCQKKLTSGLKKVIQEENSKVLNEIKKKKEDELKRSGPRMHTGNTWLNK